jgi:hypothetical protein
MPMPGAGGGVHWGAGGGGAMPNIGAGVPLLAGGEVTTWPQVGQGPLTPAMWAGTVSWVRQALHSNWMISAVMPYQIGYR